RSPRERTVERRGNGAEELELFDTDPAVVPNRREHGFENPLLVSRTQPRETGEGVIEPIEVPERLERGVRLRQAIDARLPGLIRRPCGLRILMSERGDDPEQGCARGPHRQLLS